MVLMRGHGGPASGLIATRVGGVQELVEDGISGLTIPPGDVDTLTSSIEKAAVRPGPVPEEGRGGPSQGGGPHLT